jgi:D-glycerate 3-kinase
MKSKVTAELSETARMIDAAVLPRLKRRENDNALVVGLCGAQGSGKTTICSELASKWVGEGLRVAVLSLDDLYLTRAERGELARGVHPLLATRGVPGTHDVALGIRVLQALSEHNRVRLPRFDKANDDRSPEASWDVVDAPVDLILFEGWCVGARSENSAALSKPLNSLEISEDADGRWRTYVNDRLADEYQRLFTRIDFLVLLAAPSFDVVLKWRTQQERELRLQRQGSAVMDDVALARFVQHYERLTRHILLEMPGRADQVLYLDEDRHVLRECTAVRRFD